MVYNGVAPEELTEIAAAPRIPDEPYRRILFVGRVVPDKGLHILIDAFSSLLEEFQDIRLAIVGPFMKIRRASVAIHTSKEPMVRGLAKFAGAPFEEYLHSQSVPCSGKARDNHG